MLSPRPRVSTTRRVRISGRLRASRDVRPVAVAPRQAVGLVAGPVVRRATQTNEGGGRLDPLARGAVAAGRLRALAWTPGWSCPGREPLRPFGAAMLSKGLFDHALGSIRRAFAPAPEGGPRDSPIRPGRCRSPPGPSASLALGASRRCRPCRTLPTAASSSGPYGISPCADRLRRSGWRGRQPLASRPKGRSERRPKSRRAGSACR
jgi:hypothetical protein